MNIILLEGSPPEFILSYCACHGSETYDEPFNALFCPLTMVEALCCISVDIDAVAGWLGSYGGEDSTSDISRGMPIPKYSAVSILS